MVKKSSNNRSKQIVEQAKKVLEIESRAIRELIPGLERGFCEAAQLLLSGKGRLIVTAIGKSGHIARKIAATFASTGTPALFLHPSEALHGDLGMITRKDIVLVLSNSGESEEITTLVPLIKKIGAKIIAMTGRSESTLGRLSDIVLPVKVKQEADPLNVAPTASTTASLALGDALAISLAVVRKFSLRDFAKLHPGGNIGRSLLEVKDIMHSGDENPVMRKDQSLKEGLFCITSKGLGVVSVVDRKGVLKGIVTDGDIRRLFTRATGSLDQLLSTELQHIMVGNPIFVYSDTLCMVAVKLMEDNRKHRLITVLPVVDENRHPVGMVHIHDLIRRGFSFNREQTLEE